MKKLAQTITLEEVNERLKKVIDPETGINIVDMGLIYFVKLLPGNEKTPFRIHVLYTLTTPACPLAPAIQGMVWQNFADLRPTGFEPEKDVELELTFDPPWTLDSMSDLAKAELDF